MRADGSIYHEEQRPRQWWVWLLVVLATGSGWWLMIQQLILDRPMGNKPLSDPGAWVVWALIGVGLPALFWSMRLITTVTPERLIINFRPIHTRVIALADIQQVTVRTYSPVREYGGWGIKGWSKRNIAYNMSGDRGVQLVLTGGGKVLIGSQMPEELARAIDLAQGD